MVMKLTNTADKKACFKVKTTAPKRYCVKPTTGTIDPKGAVTILVTLQPFDPNDPNEKGKHKFQVLSVIAPEEVYNIETLVNHHYGAISQTLRVITLFTLSSGKTQNWI